MEPRTVLKRLRGRAYFVYGDGRPSRRTNGENRPGLEVRPSSNGCALSSGGGNLAPSHSQSAPGPRLASFPIHAMRGRVNAPRCAEVQVAKKTWADGKQHGTKSRTAFLANWNRRRPGRNIARIFHVSWEAVPRAVGMPVAWHRADAGQEGMGALGVDETAWRGGYRDRSEVHWHAGQGGRTWEGRSAIAREGRVTESGSALGQRRAACGGFASARQAYWNTVSRRAWYAWRGAGAGTDPRARQLGEMVGRVGAVGARERKWQGRETRLRFTCCRWRRAEAVIDEWQLKPTDLPNLNLRTVQMDWPKEDIQPFRKGCLLRAGGPLRALPVPTDDPLVAGPNAKGRACVTEAPAVLAERVPLRPGGRVGRARGRTARRNRLSEERTSANPVDTAQSTWIISWAVCPDLNLSRSSSKGRILSEET